MKKACLILVSLCFILIVKGQDTIFNRIDTIICTPTENDIYFGTPYDTSVYSSKWLTFESIDTLSVMDSLTITNIDSLILISTPEDSLETILLDTLYFELRVFPVIDFIIPTVQCYSGDTLMIKDNSSYDLEYTEVTYQDPQGTPVVVIDSIIRSYVGNGDTIFITANYGISECSANFDSTVYLTTKLQPSASFDFEKTCENEFLEILNLSQDSSSSSMYDFTINNLSYSFSQDTQFTLTDTIENGSYIISSIVNNMNGCSDSISSNITIDEVTYVSFDGIEQEYCALQDSSVLIGSITAGSFQGQFVDDSGNGSAIFAPSANSSNIMISYSYTNNFQCTDVHIEFVGIVHPKPELELNNLSPEYCAQDPSTDIFINQSSGISTFGILLNNTLFEEVDDFSYTFNPEISGDYVITNFYEDINGCRDTLLNNIIVHPLPVVGLDSLEVMKPGETIVIGNNTTSEPDISFLWSNGSESSSIEVNNPGIYIIEGINTITGCSANDTIKVKYDSAIETELVEIQISPNPAMDNVTLQTSQQINGIRVVNVFGEEISFNGSNMQNTNQNGELTLDFSNKANGYYYILIPDIGNFLLVKI